MKAEPSDESARIALAKAMIGVERYDDALAELDRADSAGSVTLDSLSVRYSALKAEKRDDEALADLVRAETLAPQNTGIHYLLAQVYFNRKAYPDSVREYQAMLTLLPNNELTLRQLANVEYLAKDYVNALKYVDLLAQQSSLSVPDLFVRANSYDKLGKKPEALDAYDKFLAANTDRNSDMYFEAAERARDLRRELGKK